MKHLFFRFSLILLLVGVAGCGFQKQSFDMQGQVGDIGDAMEHCRRFMTHLLPADSYIYIDQASSRETEDHYDIFLDLHNHYEDGYGQCRVNKKGLIIYHVIRDFNERGRSFQ